jgi:hypothetical protein
MSKRENKRTLPIKEVKEPSEEKREIELEIDDNGTAPSCTNQLPLPLKATPGSSGSGLSTSLSLSNKPVHFRMSASGNLQSSAIGVLAGIISTNPSTTTFTELSSAQALYGEVKLMKAVLTLFNYNPDFDSGVGGVESGPLPVAWVSSTASAPTSVATVWGVPGCKIHGLSAKRGLTISAAVTKREYVSFVTGAYAPGPYAGMTGNFIYFQSGLSNSTTYVAWFLEIDVMLRLRQG